MATFIRDTESDTFVTRAAFGDEGPNKDVIVLFDSPADASKGIAILDKVEAIAVKNAQRIEKATASLSFV